MCSVCFMIRVLFFCKYNLQADLLELIVCGNIVGLDIPVRVVQHELWRPHILETTADDYSSECEAEVGGLTQYDVTYLDLSLLYIHKTSWIRRSL